MSSVALKDNCSTTVTTKCVLGKLCTFFITGQETVNLFKDLTEMLQERASMTTSPVALVPKVSILSPPPSWSLKPVQSENVRSPVTRSWPPGSPLPSTLAATAASMMEDSSRMEGRSLLEMEKLQLAVKGNCWWPSLRELSQQHSRRPQL